MVQAQLLRLAKIGTIHGSARKSDTGSSKILEKFIEKVVNTLLSELPLGQNLRLRGFSKLALFYKDNTWHIGVTQLI